MCSTVSWFVFSELLVLIHHDPNPTLGESTFHSGHRGKRGRSWSEDSPLELVLGQNHAEMEISDTWWVKEQQSAESNKNHYVTRKSIDPYYKYTYIIHVYIYMYTNVSIINCYVYIHTYIYVYTHDMCICIYIAYIFHNTGKRGLKQLEASKLLSWFSIRAWMSIPNVTLSSQT